ncbi:ATP-grasp domain-containing protein [Thiorhodovibrio frisius]|uniref:Biotin carboxylase n=1 Tax=Thiorhodovibrio frisius TaxID=631362 RepID=H8Z7U2_9GAMM|nr:ATP-grasp domain-containing protein [Thiorhodovibrio frisius]EIC20954.1 biotin carboxylase [Thiorhodovibrio frisius]WPL22013.1 carbamoyl phosphate synthase-like protein [Thiorhodovibrio frisius]
MSALRRNSDWRRWTVAVTGMNAIPDNPGPGLAVARCLSASNAFRGRIVGLGYDALDPGLYHDGICCAAHLLPYPSAGAEALAERLSQIAEMEKIDAIIPCLDAELTNFDAVAVALTRAGLRTFLPAGAALAARAKDRLTDLCQRLGIACPETRLVADPAFFDRPDDWGWDYPLVVKGLYYDARVAYDRDMARAALRAIAAQWGYPVLVQRFVRGHEVNLAGLGDGQGGLMGPVMMRKQALTDKGKAWAGIAIADRKLERLAERLVRALRWRGPLEVEALVGDDGELRLLEINPRFPAWIYLSHGVGRNLPELQLRLMAKEALPALPPPRPGTLFIRQAEERIVALEDYASLTTTGSLTRGAATATQRAAA